MNAMRKIMYLISIVAFAFLSLAIRVGAINTAFETNELTLEEKTDFITSIGLSVVDSEPVKKPIACFDVNYNQLVAVGHSSADKKTISIYSNKGEFQYGYTFNCNGNFELEWDEDNLNIYFVRSDAIVSVTPRGEIVDVLEVKGTIENNSYVNRFIRSTERKIGDTVFTIDNNFGVLNLFALSYSQLTVTSDNGAASVIYDVSLPQLSNIIAVIILVVACLSIALVVIIRQIINSRHGR